MENTHLGNLKGKLAPDVLTKGLNWSNKLLSVAGALNNKYISPWLSGSNSHNDSLPENSEGILFSPHTLCCVRVNGDSLIFISSSETFYLWKNHCNRENYETELLTSGSDKRIISGCVGNIKIETVIYLLVDDSDDDGFAFLVKKHSLRNDNEVCFARFLGEALSITTMNDAVVISQIGMVKLLSKESLHTFVEIPSISNVPAVFSVCDRWLALQSELY